MGHCPHFHKEWPTESHLTLSGPYTLETFCPTDCYPLLTRLLWAWQPTHDPAKAETHKPMSQKHLGFRRRTISCLQKQVIKNRPHRRKQPILDYLNPATASVGASCPWLWRDSVQVTIRQGCRHS